MVEFLTKTNFCDDDYLYMYSKYIRLNKYCLIKVKYIFFTSINISIYAPCVNMF